MASIITATVASGLTQSADNSGVLQLASGTGNLVTVPSVTGTAMVSGNMPAFSASITSNQTLTANTVTKLTFNSETFDTNSNYDPTTNFRFTPNVAGFYQINASVLLSDAASNSTGLILYLYKNGSQYAYLRTRSQVGDYTSATLAYVVSMNGSTDYLEVYAQSVSNNGIAYGSQAAYFSGALVRAA